MEEVKEVFEKLDHILIINGIGSQLVIDMDHVDSISVEYAPFDTANINFLMYSGVTRNIQVANRVDVKEILNIFNNNKA